MALMWEDILSVANISLAFTVIVTIASGLRVVVFGLHDTWQKLKEIVLPRKQSRLLLIPTDEELIKYSVRLECVAEARELAEYRRRKPERSDVQSLAHIRDMRRSEGRLVFIAMGFLSAFALVALRFIRLMALN